MKTALAALQNNSEVKVMKPLSMKQKVLNALSNGSTLTHAQISAALGGANENSFRPTLAQLENEKLIYRQSTTPPSFFITHRGMDLAQQKPLRMPV